MKQWGIAIAILLLSIFVIWLALTYGSPFLACDPQENVTEYVIDIDGEQHTTSYPMKFDLSIISEGQHTIKAKASNMWGESDWSETLTCIKVIPGKPVIIIVGE